MENDSRQNSNFLAASILVAAILISGSIIYAFGVKNPGEQAGTGNDNIAKPAGKPEIGKDVMLGNPDAKLTIFVYSDYQCPFCTKFYQDAERQIRKNYVDTGKVNMVYKDVSFLGQESIDAAAAADCAKDQGKYWDFHDAIFNVELIEAQKSGNSENTGNLNKETFKKIASDLKMNVDEFVSCFDSGKYVSEVNEDTEAAKNVLPQFSTPSVFVGDQLIQGAYPYANFSQLIDAQLNK